MDNRGSNKRKAAPQPLLAGPTKNRKARRRHESELLDVGYDEYPTSSSWNQQPLASPSYGVSSYEKRPAQESLSRTSYADPYHTDTTGYERNHSDDYKSISALGYGEQHYDDETPVRLQDLGQSDGKDNRLAVVTDFAAKRTTHYDQLVNYSPVALEMETEGGDSIPSELAVFDPKSIEEAISRFSRTILTQLSITESYNPLDNATRHILKDLERALEEFSEYFCPENFVPSYFKAAQLVRQRSIEIASQVLDILMEKKVVVREGGETGQAPVARQEDEENMKATTASSRDNLQPPLLASYSSRLKSLEPETWRLAISGSGPERYINPVGALKELTEHSYFKALLKQIEHILDCYAKQKLDTIRHRVCQCLQGQTSSYEEGIERYQTVFKIPWDLQGFLKDSYKNKKDREIGKVASVTGAKDNAILCSVAEYFAEHWPSLPEFLPEAIMSSLEYYARPEVMARKNKSDVVTSTYIRPAGNAPRNSHVYSCVVSFDPALQKLVAEGPEEFIISIAQQISWLSAVCQQKLDCLSCAYVGLRVQSGLDPTNSAEGVFEMGIQLKNLSSQDSTSCWNSLVGPAVIVSGFPVPQRKNGVYGLEISVPGMAAMAGIPVASCFDGGFIFKARHHALIPVRRLGESVQWHMLNNYPKRLDWDEIRRLYPVRLKGDIKEYAKLRSFVGYYPTVVDLIGESKPVYKMPYCVRSVADQCD